MARAVDVFRFAAIEALRDDGEAFAGDVSPNGRARRAHTLRVPVGLVAAITPFNHPLNQVAHKLAPAIAAGAPIVLKSSERTPLSAIRLGELLLDEGLPPAAAQIVCGEPAAILDEFLAHEAVEVVRSRAGASREVDRANDAATGAPCSSWAATTRCSMLADADLDETAALAVDGAFRTRGSRCTAVERIIAVADVADEWPAVLDHVSPAAELVALETFGPVAPIIRVRDLDEAIATANATRYALSSSVCTFDWRAISRCVRELRAGTVNVNEVPGWRTELTPFGGIGDSGARRQGGRPRGDPRDDLHQALHAAMGLIPVTAGSSRVDFPPG